MCIPKGGTRVRTAVYPGSFDPVTNGHMEIIRRAAAMFDRVVVLVAVNAQKRCVFTADERAGLLRSCTANMPNVSVEAHDGLVALYARDAGAEFIVKGLRAVSDFDAEFQQSLVNRRINPAAETIFLPAHSEGMYISSGMVRQVCALGGDISGFVPPEVLGEIVGRIRG